MNSFDQNPKSDSACGLEKKSKKPYSKPTFRFERVFETSALGCGKIGPTQHGCGRRGKS
jgi:hypothetical protein